MVNFKQEGTIGVIKKGQKHAKLFVKLPNNSVGNGIRFINDSIFVVADYVNHQIFKINKYTKSIVVFAKKEEMNQPNDVAISKAGNIYASDPNWSKESGQLWLVNTFGEVILLEAGMGTTNGIEVSEDEQYLYVNESVQLKVWRYNIEKEGLLSNKTLFYEFQDFGLDGMRCDSIGNLYIARYGKGTIAVLSKEGELIDEIRLHGLKPTNIAFGGVDGKSIFVTMQSKKWVEQFNAKYPGRSFLLNQQK